MNDIVPLLARIAEALERLAPVPAPPASLQEHDAYLWNGDTRRLFPVIQVAHVELALLKGIERQADTLLRNTQSFVAGRPANNALLWGAKGTGKSSLIKAVHASMQPGSVVLVEVARQEIATLPYLLELLAQCARRFILFCDDLSFEVDDAGYKSLKAVLDGGILGRPDNVIVYATSNRRHLMAREMIENETGTAIHPAEAVDEKVSLSDRFGLWLGFHNLDQETYLAIVDGYAVHAGLPVDEALHAAALEWSITRGARSGRVAWQFVQDWSGN